MTTPRYTELAAVLRAADIGICDEAAAGITDLEREVAELRARVASADADAAELADVLRFIFRYPNNWYLPRAQRALDVHRARLAAHTPPAVANQTGAET